MKKSFPKKNKSNNDPIVSKGLFRTRTYTSEPDGTYKDVVANRKGKVIKDKGDKVTIFVKKDGIEQTISKNKIVK